MNILQLAPHDFQGGASRIVWYLFQGFQQRGLNPYLAVGKKSQDDVHIFEIDQARYQPIQALGQLQKWVQIMLGREFFDYPATRHLPALPPVRPDVIHAHNLQGKYFDLRQLPALSREFPIVLTLHDTWLLSGHCAYAAECERWQTGCGHCPDLDAHPPVVRDATAFNWRRKKAIYQRAQVNVATPSQWLLDQVEQSILMPAVLKKRVIHNGVDTSVYQSADKKKVRQELGLPENAFILLYVVASRLKKHSYKDFGTIDQALTYLQHRAPKGQPMIFLGLGEAAETEQIGQIEKRFIPYQKDLHQVAKYYQAADVLLHAARADTFPNVVLEALACGTPVVATAVGGIPEQVLDGRTGYLTLPQQPEDMCEKVLWMLHSEEKRAAMSMAALEDVQSRFLIARMLDEYIAFYQEILADFSTRPPR